MPKEKPIRVEGVITETLPNVMYKVRLDNGHELIAHVSGKMRMRYIRIVKGDRVSVEMSPYDITKGRIVWLHR